ncbi:hypothetical protein HC891_20065 [Candidatus Gracilibacteria bacterium]|nr:hypothetical protein [Candidatus Gracilibacteria bacterium]
MTPLFKKLNYKDQATIAVINAPESFGAELSALRDVTVLRSLDGEQEVPFVLAFVTTLAVIEQLASLVGAKTQGDAVIWFAYPKGTSKKYTCEFNRDSGWNALGTYGFEGVRQVAIDADWSALRFRRVEFIKTLTRNASRRISGTGQVSGKMILR